MTFHDEESGVDHAYSSRFGPATVVVLGDTLFFYSFSSDGQIAGLPRLSSLIFHEYRPDVDIGELMSHGLRGYDILDYSAPLSWSSVFSPIYPSGDGAVTVSVKADSGGVAWVVDVPVISRGTVANRGPLIHYSADNTPSARESTREVATFPGYTCRTQSGGPVLCHSLGDGRFTWSSEAQTILGRLFEPLTSSFELPDTIWLHVEARGHYSPLVGAGLAPSISIANNRLYCVIT